MRETFNFEQGQNFDDPICLNGVAVLAELEGKKKHQMATP
jgi:hypothetical protein